MVPTLFVLSDVPQGNVFAPTVFLVHKWYNW